MLLNLLRGGNSQQIVMGLLSALFVVFCTMPIHEFAHAYVATKLGDDTPRLRGRLTLNPLAHIDILGAVMILLVGFGYAKPVPVSMRRFKKPKRDMALTALAGPVSNLIMAAVFMFFENLFEALYFKSGGVSVFFDLLSVFFYFAAYINVGLMVFNLLPVPPLDGYRVASALIPYKYYFKIMQYERYIMYGVMVLLFLGVLSKPLSLLSSLVLNGLGRVTGMLVSLLI